MKMLDRWRTDRDLRARASGYAAAMAREPSPELVQWLAATATRGDEDHAAWELRYARRALGLIAAQRDALDDRTGSLVAAALTERFRADPRIARGRAELAERQFNARLAAFADTMRARASGVPAPARLAGIVLRFAAGEGREHSPETVARLAGELSAVLIEANEELRRHFGQVALPEDVKPSSITR